MNENSTRSPMEDAVAARGGALPIIGGAIALISFFLPYASTPSLLGFQISRSGLRIGGAMWLVFLASAAIILVYVMMPGEKAQRDRDLLIRVSSIAGMAILLLALMKLYKKTSVFGVQFSASDLGIHLNVGGFGSFIGFALALAGTFSKRDSATTTSGGVSARPAIGAVFSNAQASAAPVLESAAREMRALTDRTRAGMPELRRHTAMALQSGAAWARTHKLMVASVATGIIALFGAYAVFGPDPYRDGKSVAAMYAGCTSDMRTGVERAQRDVLAEWRSHKPATRSAARQKLDQAYSPIRSTYSKCVSAADQEFTRIEARYTSDADNAKRFQDGLQQTLPGGRPTANEIDDSSPIAAELNSIVTSILPPLPDDSRVVSDLLGQQVDGWRFAYPSEFLTIGREQPSFSADNVTLRLHCSMQDYNTHEPYFAVVDVRYALDGSDEWHYDNVRELYLTKTDTTKYRENGAFMLLGSWRWADHEATYLPDGTWTGRADDGTGLSGEWRIVHDNLVVTRNGYSAVNTPIASYATNEIVLQDGSRAERIR